MTRVLLSILIVFTFLWAPWMDSHGGVASISEQVFESFGPVASSCYDADGKLLQEGVDVRWYPLGRLVHTCAGDYVVWMWGAVKEQGGVYKRPGDLQAVQTKALTCEEVLSRKKTRFGTTSISSVERYDGPVATDPDFSIFKEGEQQRQVIQAALKKGPTFAGKFTVAEWGCGSNCQEHAIVNVETGLVIAYGLQTEFGVEYTLEDTLFVTNPVGKLPPLSDSAFETETTALAIAKVAREYFHLTTDALSGSQYLVRACVENSATGYIEVEDDRLGVIDHEEKN